MKRRTRFKGDLQVDGQILGPDGQPVGGDGGGSVDWATPIPELHFLGDPEDLTSGISLAWDEDFFGLAAKGRPGTGYAQLLAVNPDDATEYAYLDSGGFGGNNSQGTVALYPGSLVIGHPYDPGPMLLWNQQYGMQMNGGVSGDSLMFITPDDGLGQGFVGLALLLANAQAVLDPDVLHFAKMDDGLGLSAKPEFAMKLDGTMHWGAGGAIDPDVTLKRSGVGWMVLESQGSSMELDISGNASIFVLDNEDDWNDYAEYAYNGWQVDYPGGNTSLNINSGQPQLWMQDTHAVVNWVPQQLHFYYQADDPTHQFMEFTVAGDSHPRFKLDQNGRHGWGPGGGNSEDVHLKRRAAGVLELEENGGGLVLHSPDGTAYKISVANGGALSAVAA